jgi:hypothetical protein
MAGGSGLDARRRRILAGALGAALWPVAGIGQDAAAANRAIYLYRGADRDKRLLEGAQ